MQIPISLRKEMLAHLEACLPEEGCGLLGGIQGKCSLLRLVSNDLHSPTGFRMNPQEQLQAFLLLEEMGLDLLAVFHSHPHGPQIPSATDVSEFAYPGVISLICVPSGADWIVRGFAIDGKRVTEITLTWD
ncbi:M67 family metallopeptidase [bacterium]|nr:M67 family peptidase [bacterium]TLN25064.1 MAG: M67 family metallopeptidase [bacterium]